MTKIQIEKHFSGAYTLIELIISISIFAMIATGAISVLLKTMQSAKKIEAQAFLYTESQAILDKLAQNIDENTIDYEAYFDRLALESDGWHTENYGYYGQAFFDPGSAGPIEEGPYDKISAYSGVLGGNYGMHCYSTSDSSDEYPKDCPAENPVYSEGDFNTGAFPYSGDAEEVNAFCANVGSCETGENQMTEELILINEYGDQRYIFKKITNETSGKSESFVGKIELNGSDSNGDGIIDVWQCNSDYSCNDVYTKNSIDYFVPAYADFVSINPSLLQIDSLKFLISPAEDPFKAFSEKTEQIHPQITIILTASLSEKYSMGLLGASPSITLQRTVSTGVYGGIKSYYE